MGLGKGLKGAEGAGTGDILGTGWVLLERFWRQGKGLKEARGAGTGAFLGTGWIPFFLLYGRKNVGKNAFFSGTSPSGADLKRRRF